MNDNVLRVLLLEDNPVMVEHITEVLSQWSRPSEVLVASTVARGCAFGREKEFDLLIADMHLPDGEGIEVIKTFRREQPLAQAIVFSALNEKTLVLRAIKAGASGYIHKEDSAVDLLRSFEEILAGGSPMSVAIARLVIESMQTGIPLIEQTGELSLTPRESEIIQALAKGYSNTEIADLFQVSAQTIPVHVRNIYKKLEVKNRTEAVFEARRIGLIS